MKYLAALLTIAIAPLALAAPATEGTFSVAAFSSKWCATSSTLVQTIAGIPVNAGRCFSLAQPMASFNVVMTGVCSVTSFFFDSACATAFGSDVGSPWIAGCQTFTAGPMGSFKISCSEEFNVLG